MKSERQNKIIELITKNSIGTQEELAEALKQAGFSAVSYTHLTLPTILRV